jgi:hypothetical protein
VLRITFAAFLAALASVAVAGAEQPTSTSTATATSTLTATAVGTATPNPTAGVTPTASPSPLPPVSDLTLDLQVDILRPDNSFIPPEERKATVVLSWARPAAFSGSYAIYRLNGGPSGNPVLIASVPAGSGAKVAFSEPIQWPPPHTCYQVRSVAGSDIGPAAEACTPLVPTSGPGGAASVTPAPPGAGTGRAPEGDHVSSTDWLIVVGACGAAGALSSYVWSRHRREARRTASRPS